MVATMKTGISLPFILILALGFLHKGNCGGVSGNYPEVESVCKEELESWSGISTNTGELGHNNTSSWLEGSFIIGEWQSKAEEGDGGGGGGGGGRLSLVAGEKGFFHLLTLDRLDHSTTLKNVTGSAHLGAGDGAKSSGAASSSPRYVDLRLAGVLNSISGELCMAACLSSHSNQTTAFNSSSPDCNIRMHMSLKYSRIELFGTNVEGTIESVRGQSDPLFFPTVEIHAVKQNIKDQHTLFMATLGVRFATIFVEFILVIAQTFYSLKRVDAYYISTLGLSAQIAILGFRWIRALYLPLKYFRKFSYKFLLRTWTWTTPLLSDFLLILAYIVLVLVVALKWRRKARMGVADHKGENIKVREWPLWVFGLPLYMIIGLVLWWWTQGLQTYLQVVLFWWLLPQIVANVMWDLRSKPMLVVFILGVSLCRFVILSFDTFRPTIYGYDEIYNFPSSWYWGVSMSLILLVSMALSQQAYGGRWFIPKRLYGYQQLELTGTTNFKLEVLENDL